MPAQPPLGRQLDPGHVWLCKPVALFLGLAIGVIDIRLSLEPIDSRIECAPPTALRRPRARRSSSGLRSRDGFTALDYGD